MRSNDSENRRNEKSGCAEHERLSLLEPAPPRILGDQRTIETTGGVAFLQTDTGDTARLSMSRKGNVALIRTLDLTARSVNENEGEEMTNMMTDGAGPLLAVGTGMERGAEGMTRMTGTRRGSHTGSRTETMTDEKVDGDRDPALSDVGRIEAANGPRNVKTRSILRKKIVRGVARRINGNNRHCPELLVTTLVLKMGVIVPPRKPDRRERKTIVQRGGT